MHTIAVRQWYYVSNQQWLQTLLDLLEGALPETALCPTLCLVWYACVCWRWLSVGGRGEGVLAQTPKANQGPGSGFAWLHRQPGNVPWLGSLAHWSAERPRRLSSYGMKEATGFNQPGPHAKEGRPWSVLCHEFEHSFCEDLSEIKKGPRVVTSNKCGSQKGKRKVEDCLGTPTMYHYLSWAALTVFTLISGSHTKNPQIYKRSAVIDRHAYWITDLW